MPETVHTAGVWLLKVTGKPAEEVALSVPEPLTATEGAAPKLIVWLLFVPTGKLCVTCGAAL